MIAIGPQLTESNLQQHSFLFGFDRTSDISSSSTEIRTEKCGQSQPPLDNGRNSTVLNEMIYYTSVYDRSCSNVYRERELSYMAFVDIGSGLFGSFFVTFVVVVVADDVFVITISLLIGK